MPEPKPRVSIREFRPSDAPAIVRLADDRGIWQNLRDRFPHPYTAADARTWLEFVATHPEPLCRAIEVDGELAGSLGGSRRADVERFSAEVGYWVGRPFWNRGIATSALSLFVAYVFETSDLIRLDATVFETNPASARVLEKCGFHREGILRRAVVKDGRVLDSYLYSRLREDRPPSSSVGNGDA